jgi:2',3'-cyclic-nucleotide 2'-phosphodiesterase/3'-nucleotidase
VPGIDLILLGHTHREIPALVVNGVLLAQAGRWADHVIKADLYFSREPGAAWKLYAKESRSLRLQGVEADPEILALTQPYHEETEAWLKEPIGTCGRDIDARAIFSDSAMLDLVQRLQLEAGAADVSLASIFNPAARIKAGPVTVREMAGLYIYDNTLMVVRASGAQLKAALEQSAEFILPWAPDKTLNQLVNPRFYLYNFDQAAGVSYEVDVRRPLGDRILNLSFRGRPVRPEETFRLALNNYRYAGGGGYDMFKADPVLFRSSIQLRDLLIDWVEKHHAIPTTPVGNWRIVGAGDAAQAEAPHSEVGGY